MPNNIISIQDLFKCYPKSKVNALNGLSLNVAQGDFFGLLGPNGSGKTTLISILCGLFQANYGDIRLLDKCVPQQLQKIKRQIGLVPQEIALYPSLTLQENMHYFGQLYHIDRKTLKSRIEILTERVGLTNFLKQTIRSYSGGMKRRANLITTLLHEPRLLFLDEPTANVDPQSREMIFTVLKELNNSGTTLIYTSHHMGEIQTLCNTVAILDRGELIAHDNTLALIQKTPHCNNLGEVFLKLTGHALRDELPC